MARPARRLGPKLLWSGIVVLSLAALAPPALYLIGLAVAPELPAPPETAERLPPLVEQALWAHFGGRGPVHLEPVTVGGIARFEWCMVRQGLLRGDLERCRSGQRSLLLASLVSATHLGLRGGGTEPGLEAALAHGSTTTWISRHWTAAELLVEYAGTEETESPWGGIEETSNTLFALPPDALLPHQAALLAALYRQTEPLDPKHDPDRARAERNRVLEQMTENGALEPEQLPDLLRRPLGVVGSRPIGSPPKPSIPFPPHGGKGTPAPGPSSPNQK